MGVDTNIQAIRSIVGEKGLLLDEDARMRTCDIFRRINNQATVVVRPGSVEELAEVVRYCHGKKQTMVVQGGLTGVAGGAITRTADIAISLERLNRIESISPVTRTAVVQAGVVVQALEEAAEEQGMLYPVDLGARGTATVGGTIATNAGGNQVIRWGMTRNVVLGLEVVLPDGTIVSSMNDLLKNNTGYDLKQLFIGAEGTLGIITRAVMRLVPKPRSNSVALIALNSYQDVLKLLNRALAISSLTAFELMWKDYYTLIACGRPEKKPLAEKHAYYVLIETKGFSAETDQKTFEQFLEEAYEHGLIAEAVVAQSEQQARELWAVREASEIILREMSPILSFDISLPITVIEEYVKKLKSSLAEQVPAARSIVFGHIGDNNIHVGITAGRQTSKLEHCIKDLVYLPLAEMQGSVSAEHGIGIEKKDYLAISRNDTEIALMKKFKQLLDPDNLMNPQVMF